MSAQALLLLDLQNEIVHPEGKLGRHGLAANAKARSVLANAKQVLEAFRSRRLKIAHVRLAFRADYLDVLSVAPRIAKLKEAGAAIIGTWGTEFAAEVAPAEGELIVTKQCVNPFFNTGLYAWLARHSVREVVLGGVATNLVVESAARFADDAGFAVTVLEDCCASMSEEMHQFAISKTLPIFARVTNSAAYLSELDVAELLGRP
jgi:nicotinamidase-related amidase